jgi:serine phosphatase RsbU (regulator of sigma subunit)
VKVMESIPLEASDALSPAIIHYVYKTMENVVLHDACKDARFGNDPYIVKNKSKSILCSPIRHKGRMSGILYLENNLTAGAFTSERLDLLRTFSAQAAISIENSRLLKAREKAAALLTEMKIAANIQTSLLPKNPSMEGFEITAYLKPADEIGGDYYDFIHTDALDWVIIGDVSGHGVPAGLVMMMVQTSIQSLLKDRPDVKPSELLCKVNNVIKDNIIKLKENKYMTITAFTFDREGRSSFSGLHQDILVYRAIDGHVDVLDTDGIWLSAWDFGRDNVDMELKLEKNDVILLFTDGVTEAKNNDGEFFSAQPLINILKEAGGRTTEDIKKRVLKALGDFNTIDDVTLIIMKKL